MAHKPNIRFKSFEENWLTTTIGEVFKERDERSADGELLSVTINHGIRRAKEMDRTFATGDLSHYKVVKVGDIAYNTMRMWQGACGVSKYSGIVSPAYTIATPCKGHIGAFYANMFKTNHMLHDFRINSQGLTSDTWNLKYYNFSKIQIKIPNEAEQKEVSKIIESISASITQREKELEKLKNIKRAVFEKLFPQNGEKVPALRFKEFTEEWGEVALGSIADRVTTKNSSKAYTETFTNSAEHGIMSQSDFFDHAIANQENIARYYIVQENDFVYNPRISKLAPVGPINRNKLGRTGVVSPLYTVFRPKNVSVEYLEVFFMQNSWNRFMNFNGNSGARLDRFSISDAVFWQMPIQYPQIEEQQKIAKLITTLSNLLSLREKQLALLKHTKQALLEQMFVNE